MIRLTQTINDPNGIVSKLIFEDEGAIAEAVAYRYQDRGVVCFSVQSGCRVGCRFCGTGRKFIRDLSSGEMLLQIGEALKVIGHRDRLEIMSMSMGEPMDNWDRTRDCIGLLMESDPNTRFYLSTTCLDKPNVLTEIVDLGKAHPNFGLQFSLHHWNNFRRKALLGNFAELMPLPFLMAWANNWKDNTGKRAYFNYIATGKETMAEAKEIARVVKGQHLTCSVMCNTRAMKVGLMNPATELSLMVNKISDVAKWDIETSVFNPAGQDTVGGGCGQLLYVQKKLKEIV